MDDGSRQCVLVIDDSPTDLRLLNKMLWEEYDVRVVNNGGDGIKFAQKHEVDLILLDLKMPDMSGFEVLRTLKSIKETEDIPVIIVSSSDADNIEEKVFSLGAVDFIRKPVTASVVKLRVSTHLKLRDYIKTIEKLTAIDELTGISNRRSFDRVIKSEWSRAMRKQEWLGMLILDIDMFKQFNDKYGHLSGDDCIKTIAGIMSRSIARGSDHVFRWGGEEFVAILPDTPIEGVRTVAERLRQEIADTSIHCDGKAAAITASIGIGAVIPSVPSENPKDTSNVMENFFTRIDSALYRAKELGRNRVEAIE